MSEKINTFSENSLKVLEKSVTEFKNKYENFLYLMKKDKRAILGQKFHSLICSYIKGYDTDRISQELSKEEIKVWKNIKNILKDKKINFIETEYPFLTKEKLNDKFYYLTGRFDAVYKESDEITLYDWKTNTLPENPKDDLQTIVYLYCANKIFNTKKIKIRYLSLEKLDYTDVEFISCDVYKNRIDSIVKKYI